MEQLENSASAAVQNHKNKNDKNTLIGSDFVRIKNKK